MVDHQDLAFLDAVAQAELIKKREITPLELVQAAVERIEALNPKLNAVIAKAFDQALEAAKDAAPVEPFRGVPFLVKDFQAFWAGLPMTSGSRFMKDFIPDHDSEIVLRWKRAGLVLLGKTNVSELALLPTAESRLFGPCRNPWDPERTTGGSSGGSSAAVAAGIVPMAHANDGGGSIRIPASCCGLFGLKPTRGRNPLGPDFGDVMHGLVCEHAVTRSIRDSAALLDATSGPGAGDPYYAPAPQRPFSRELGVEPGRLRIGFTDRTPKGDPVHPDCADAVQKAAALCSELGHHVEEASPEMNVKAMGSALFKLWAGGKTADMMDMARLSGKSLSPEEFEPLTWAWYQIGLKQTAADHVRNLTVLQGISRQIAQFFETYDLWLTPTLAEPPVPLGTFDSPPEEPLKGLFRSGEFMPFTAAANVTGQPAMTVPLFWNGEGLPIGIQFMGRYGDETTLFRVASQLETARPWRDRRPVVC